MTTRSTASHELPSTIPLASSQGQASQLLPEREDSAWAARLQRARAALRGAVRGVWTSGQPIDASSAPAAVIAVATDSAPPSQAKIHREEDRTTRIYQRPVIESALSPVMVRGELPGDDGSTTLRLPSAHLEVLLLQLQYDAEIQAAAARPASPDTVSATDVEISSITFEELEAFRRSLGDSAGESEAEVLSAPTAPPPALSAETASGSALRRLHSAKDLTLRWGGALAARCVLRLRYLGLVLMATIVKFRTRRERPMLPVPVATGSHTETKQDASASR